MQAICFFSAVHNLFSIRSCQLAPTAVFTKPTMDVFCRVGLKIEGSAALEVVDSDKLN